MCLIPVQREDQKDLRVIGWSIAQESTPLASGPVGLATLEGTGLQPHVSEGREWHCLLDQPSWCSFSPASCLYSSVSRMLALTYPSLNFLAYYL